MDPLPNDQPMTKRERRLLRKQEKQEARDRTRSRKSFGRWITIAVVVVVLGGGIAWIMASGNPGETIDVSGVDTDPTKGPESATVLVEEYSDFQCPACKAAQPLVKSIVEQYGDRIRFAYNDFPLRSTHRNAQRAAEAGQCAFAQEKFWEYHDKLFEEQSNWSTKSGSDLDAAFTQYAKDMGIDEAAFTTCLTGGTTKTAVDRDVAEGKRRKVNATPTFFVGEEKIEGVKEADLKDAIQKALGEG